MYFPRRYYELPNNENNKENHSQDKVPINERLVEEWSFENLLDLMNKGELREYLYSLSPDSQKDLMLNLPWPMKPLHIGQRKIIYTPKESSLIDKLHSRLLRYGLLDQSKSKFLDDLLESLQEQKNDTGE